MKRVVVRVYAGDAKTKGNPVIESTGFVGTSLSTPGSSNSTDWTAGTAVPTGTEGTNGTAHADHARQHAHPSGGRPDRHAEPHHDPYHASPADADSMNRNHRPAATGGFTLIEIMVALLILGIMAALGYGTYRAARISAERTEESLQRSREIEFGMRMLVQDVAQTVPRPVRDILGQSRLPAMQGSGGFGTLSGPAPSSGTALGSNSGMSFATQSFTSQSFNSGSATGSSANKNAAPLIDLTRGGWSNTAGQQRSTLQRVSYALVGDISSAATR